jgi:hypothetical protein
MTWKKKTLCYVLVFDQVDIVEKCLKSLIRHANDMDIVVIENPSDGTPKIKDFVNDLGKKKLVKRYYLFDKNITNNAFKLVLAREQALIKKTRYVITTDGDLTCEDDWLKETTCILRKHPEVFACGVSLDMSNLPVKTFPDATGWVPDDISEQPDYYEAVTGSHLLTLRGSDFYTFLRWKDKNNIHLVDSTMHDYCYRVLQKKWTRTKHSKAYHLTWDLYQDLDHPYTKLKTEKSFAAIWHHQDSSEYSLKEY